MALWTEFLREQQRAEQTARARGREVLSPGEMAGAVAPIATRAMAEERGVAAGETRRLGREELATRGERFTGRMELGRGGLALERERAGTEKMLGRGRLRLARKEYEHMKEMGPWALGLGATEIALSGVERAKQQRRDKEYWRVLGESLRKEKRRPYYDDEGVPGRGSVLGTY